MVLREALRTATCQKPIEHDKQAAWVSVQSAAKVSVSAGPLTESNSPFEWLPATARSSRFTVLSG